MSHANARLTPAGRFIMVSRIQAGRPVAHVAAEMGVSRTTAWRWWGRFREFGPAGLVDRPSNAHNHPRQIGPCQETRVRILRALTRRSPVFIGDRLRMHASTVGRILARHHTPLLRDTDPITGQLIRATRHSANRYEHDHPGSLIHADVKKIGRIPDGGGWRAHGRTEKVRGRGIGYDYIHTAIDDHSRVAFIEILPDERGTTTAGFLDRAIGFFAGLGVAVERVITDNALNYRRSSAVRETLDRYGVEHRFIRPHCPWTNGKAERLNRTLATEWAYSRPFTSNHDRTAALPAWLDYYNLDRHHLGIAGKPIDRINNGRGQYN